MKNQIMITARVFPLVVHDHRTGKEEAITVPVTKEQLRAAQLVGQSSTELIERICDRQGYTVIEIGQPDKFSMKWRPTGRISGALYVPPITAPA